MFLGNDSKDYVSRQYKPLADDYLSYLSILKCFTFILPHFLIVLLILNVTQWSCVTFLAAVAGCPQLFPSRINYYSNKCIPVSFSLRKKETFVR